MNRGAHQEHSGHLAAVELASATVAITGGTFAGDGDVLSIGGQTGGTIEVGASTLAVLRSSERRP